MDKPDYIHPDYKHWAEKWKRCRDAVRGQDAVHAAGTQYLPRLTEQTEVEYDAYLKRTPYFNATGRTLNGLLGMVFRKDPHTEVPVAMEPYLEDITLSGLTMNGMARQVLSEVEEVGRCGVLVEFPRVDQQPTNLAQALAANLRPYATLYKAESIINWRVQRINNQMMPTLIVLAEQVEQMGVFYSEMVDQIRVLTLASGFYEVVLYQRTSTSGDYVEVDRFTPLMNGQPMGMIPFYAFGPDELSLTVQCPPMLDLVDLNLSHYRTNADLEHGAHFTGLPTPMLAGFQFGENEAFRIGSGAGVVSPDPSAKWGFLEFTGQGLGALERLLDRKEAQMAAIGARMLAPEKAQAEAAQTVMLRHGGETSILASQARLVSVGLQQMLDLMRTWAGIAGECVYRLNTDYMPVKMTAQELTALVQSWQSGAISKQTLFYNLQEGEIIQSEKTFADQEEEMEMQGPRVEDLESAEIVDFTNETPTVSIQPQQAPFDMTPLIQAIQAMQQPSATVRVEPTDLSPIIEAIQAMPAPIINVSAPEVNIQPAPAPIVNIPPVEQNRQITFIEDRDGNITGAIIE